MPAPETLRIRKTNRLSDPFIAAGDRAYIIGTQDGLFPDMGWHTEGEMGGVWMHPIKLLDGFWLRVDDTWLPPASSFTTGPFWSEHEFDLGNGLAVRRRQFVPDGQAAILLRYTFWSAPSRQVKLRFLARTDFHDVWPCVAEGSSGQHSSAMYLRDLGAWLGVAGGNPWFVVIGSSSHAPVGWQSTPELSGPEPTRGRGNAVALEYNLDLTAGRELYLDFVIAGSSTGPEQAKGTFARAANPDVYWQAQAARYRALLDYSVLDVPDPSLTRAWDWAKCTYHWLVRDVPEVGRGLGAGVADYPWWFSCDNCYALLGCLAIGQHELALETMDLLRVLSNQANGPSGRVIHECNTRGYATDRGRTQETPQFVATVWDVFRWTGDLAFLRRSYPFCRDALLDWTLGSQTPEGDLFPSGEGVIEHWFLDRQCIDSAVHTARALAALSSMAGLLGDEVIAERCRTLAATARGLLDEAFWMENEGLYGDILATPEEMIPRISTWIAMVEQDGKNNPDTARILGEVEELLREAQTDPRPGRKRAWLCKNWIVIAPLEGELAPRDKALRVLDRVETPEFSGPWGMYLSGIHRTQAMSINTGVLAVAEITYGRAEKGLAYVRQLTDTLELRTPGAISEISPDEGCFVQAWSGYAVAWPVVAHVFGLQPDAYRRRLVLRPQFPESWQEASLANVRIGDASFDFHWDGHDLRVTAPDREWNVWCTAVPTRVDYFRDGPDPGGKRVNAADIASQIE